MQLHVLENGSVVHSVQLGGRPLAIGRAPDNDLILTSAGISSHHALCFRERDEVRVRDLGSTNGTFLNDERITEAVLRVGDLLRLGEVVLRATDDQQARVGFQIRRVDGPVAWNVEPGFALPDHPASMFFVEEGTVYLQNDGHTRSLQPDVPFDVDGVRFVLTENLPTARTVPLDGLLPYDLTVDLDRNVALLAGGGAAPVEITASTRVALLYVLAGETGWVPDDTIGAGVWGRAWVRNDPNNLNVLLHRIRQQVHRAGYDRHFIERRRGAMRLRVTSARRVQA